MSDSRHMRRERGRARTVPSADQPDAARRGLPTKGKRAVRDSLGARKKEALRPGRRPAEGNPAIDDQR